MPKKKVKKTKAPKKVKISKIKTKTKNNIKVVDKKIMSVNPDEKPTIKKNKKTTY